MDDLRVAFVTVSGEEEGEKIARTLLEERLAACVNIIPAVRSIYRWKGAIEDESESLLIIKSGEAVIERLKRRLREIHSYDIPELLVLPVADGLEEYIKWATGELGEDESV